MNSAKEQPSEEGDLNSQGLSRRAREQLDAGQFGRAVDLYDRALSVEAGRVDDWVNRGLALWSLGNNQAALESYDHALALDPDHAIGWLNRGNALREMERHAEALECYDRALGINEHLPRAWFNKGNELGRQSRIIEAKACFENARDLGRDQNDNEVSAEAASMVARCESILMSEYYG